MHAHVSRLRMDMRTLLLHAYQLLQLQMICLLCIVLQIMSSCATLSKHTGLDEKQ